MVLKINNMVSGANKKVIHLTIKNLKKNKEEA